MAVCLDLMCLNVECLSPKTKYVAALWIGGVIRRLAWNSCRLSELLSHSKDGAPF